MKKIIAFSGGKDSTALVLWAKENLKEFTTIFCDTGWEHPLTYEYVEYINQKLLDGKLIRLKSEKYEGFEDLCIKKKRVASTKARFCTEELKLKPTREFIGQMVSLDRNSTPRVGNVFIYLGIRADESFARSQILKPNVYDPDYYKCSIKRPLLRWTVEEVFLIHKRHNIKPNPLYKKGMKRVGCLPCININLGQVKNIATYFPDAIDKVRKLEKEIGRSFFPPNAIPQRYMTGFDDVSGKPFPWIDDIVKYVLDDPDQIKMFPEDEPERCMSYYSICE